MTSKKFKTWFFSACLTLTSISHAGLIVDSGPGRSSGGLSLGGQWLAQQFTTTSNYRISGIQGWIGGFGDATAALYMSGPSGPITELFSSVILVSGGNDWHGVDGLSFDLGAGTYWLAFEVRSGQQMRGYMGGEPTYQLGNWAYGGGGNWNMQSVHGLGIRLFGEQTVPEPTSFALAISAIAACVAVGVSRGRKLIATA